jgi:hypothetical protein
MTRTWDSPRYQAGDYLGEQDNQENYGNSNPKQSDACRAAFSALIAPTIQLNKPNYQQEGCTPNEPIAEGLRPNAETCQSHRAKKTQRQTASQSRKRSNYGGDGSCSLCHTHRDFTPYALLWKRPIEALPLMEPRFDSRRADMLSRGCSWDSFDIDANGLKNRGTVLP